MKNKLLEHYRLRADRMFKVGQYDAFQVRNVLYLIIPVKNMEQEEILETKLMADFLLEKGDYGVATILPTTSGDLTCEIENSQIMVGRCYQLAARKKISIGKELFSLHKRGRVFPYQIQKLTRIGQWKYLWEKRLDQMEEFWKQRISQQPESHFETLFIESFPYYLGLTENAIQYLVDTEIDDFPLPTDSATICHHRFTNTTWREQLNIKIPVNWVYDHYSRDLAEYMRDQYLQNYTFEQSVVASFINEYSRESQISSFAWRLLYARMLFPLHYFETIEGYYLFGEKTKPMYEKQLETHLERTSDYERYLGALHYLASKHSRLNIPQLEWLVRG